MSPLRSLALAAAAALGLGGCVYDGYGSGIGVSVGYGGGYGGYSGYGNRYCDPYWDDCYRYARRGSYDPWRGWYDGYYYPGSGYYVYDRHRRPHRWNDRQRRYWMDRRRSYRGAEFREDRRRFQESRQEIRRERRMDVGAVRQQRREESQSSRRGELMREQSRSDRRQDRHDLPHERSQVRLD